MRLHLFVMFLVFVCSHVVWASPDGDVVRHKKLLDAIQQVESSGKDPDKVPDGDKDHPRGPSIGPFQIMECYWHDAVHRPTADGEKRVHHGIEWKDCRDPDKARVIVVLYWDRYGRKAMTAKDNETLARLHNGGPGYNKGRAAANTRRYWGCVKAEMDRGG